MNERTNPRRPTLAVLGAVAAALAIVGGLWYVTSDGTERDAALDRPTGQPVGQPASTTSSETTVSSIGEPTATVLAQRHRPRASVILPIPPGETELSDTEVLLLDGDSIVAVDVDTTTARVLTPAPAPRRLVGVTNGAVVVERCCNAELVIASETAEPLLTFEFDPTTEEGSEQPVTGWRLASIRPSGGRMAAVAGTDLVISSLTGGSGTGRSLLDRDEETDEPVFGTVVDLGWSPNGATIVLIEELGDEVVAHRVGGNSGTPVDRVRVADLDAVERVEFAGIGVGGTFAVAVHSADDDGTEVQFFDQTTLRLVERAALPADVEQVRSLADGSMVWIDDGVITIRRPNGDVAAVALP